MADADDTGLTNANTSSDLTAKSGSVDSLSPWSDSLPDDDSQVQSPQIVGTLYDNTQTVAPETSFNVPANTQDQIVNQVPAEQYVSPPPVQAAPPALPTSVPNPVPLPPIRAQSLEQSNPAMNVGQISQQNIPNTSPKGDIRFVAVPKSANVDQSQGVEMNDNKIIANNTAPKSFARSRILDASGAQPSRPNPFMKLVAYKQQLSIILSILCFAILIIVFTEIGELSIGAEKIYGAIRLEKLWGGLSSDTKSSLGVSLNQSVKHPDFKIRGSISIAANAKTESKFIAPIFSLAGVRPALADIQLNNSTLTMAKLASVDQSSDTVLDGSTTTLDIVDEDQGNTNQAIDTDQISAPTNQNSNVNPNTNSAEEQSQYPSYQNDQSKREIYADISGAFATGGAESIFKIKKVNGTTDVTVKSASGKVSVNSNDIKFDQAETADNWLEYSPDALVSGSAQQVFTNSAKNLSIQGKRLSNEIVGGVRCYKYSLNITNLDSFLSNWGITAKVDNVSGFVWIGVKDKLIRRTILTINGDASNVSTIGLTLDFYEYDMPNNFTTPDANQVVVMTKTTSEPVQNTNTNSISTDPDDNSNTAPTIKMTNDQQRKTDLVKLRTALDSYAAANSKYPVSTSFINLGASGNVVTNALVSKYLGTMLYDPRAAEGWYYGYKSTDGKSFTLSAKLEDPNDAQLTTVDGNRLYLLSNSVYSNSATPDANDKTRKSDLVTIKSSLEKYKLAKGSYPIANELTKLYIQGNVVSSALVPNYLSSMPLDPKNDAGWYYAYKSTDGKSFSISARLENTSDPQAQKSNGVYLYFVYNNDEVLQTNSNTSSSSTETQNGYGFY
ncbi:MAG: type II secretion system protein GspG [bacterium]